MHKLLIFMGIGLLLSGCGQSGPLYLPTPPAKAPATQTAS